MRYALGVEYDGSNFKGWQRLTPYGQEGGPRTLQVTLEDALSGVASQALEFWTSLCYIEQDFPERSLHIV